MRSRLEVPWRIAHRALASSATTGFPAEGTGCRSGPTERWLLLVILCMVVGLGLSTTTFLTLPNIFDLANSSAVNIIFGVGLLVVLIAGGIDISFAVAASVVQYLVALSVGALGGGDWAIGFALAGLFGTLLGCVNAFLIYQFRIVSIVVTIATYNLFFGLLMFFSGGVFPLRPAGLVGGPVSARRRLHLRRPCRTHASGRRNGVLRDGDLVPAAPHVHGPPALCHGRTTRKPPAASVSASARCTTSPSAGSASWPASQA